ncbi:MAG: acyl-CoA dehydrogenase [Aliidongia sp.]
MKSSAAPASLRPCSAARRPDSGNAETLAHYGTAEQKRRYLQPLLDNEIVSAFSMTEPQGGSDPLTFTTAARLDGGHWVINGEKWFSTNARWAEFLIVMAVTDPDGPPYRRLSMFIVPRETPGVEIVRNVAVGYGHRGGTEGYVRYTDVRVPLDHMLGERGDAFVVAQTRLGGGRIHHAMRTVGQAKKALDLMCQRVVSRQTRDGRLADKQMVQEKIADSWIELEQFRLLVLRTAWLIDKHKDYRKVRKDIAAVKAAMPKLYHDIAARALHLHGALGVSDEMPFVGQGHRRLRHGDRRRPDGSAQGHGRETGAAQLPACERRLPAYHLPKRRDAALEKYADLLEPIDDEF